MKEFKPDIFAIPYDGVADDDKTAPEKEILAMRARQEWRKQREINAPSILAEMRTKQVNIQLQKKKDAETGKVFKKDIQYRNIIGERIAFIREKFGYSKVEFTNRAEMDRTTLYRIENGEIVPSFKLLEKMIKALGCEIADFTDYPDDFEKFKENFYPSQYTYDIQTLYDEIMDLFDRQYYYTVNGAKRIFPIRYLNVLKNTVDSAFNIVDLIEHDNPDNTK